MLKRQPGNVLWTRLVPQRLLLLTGVTLLFSLLSLTSFKEISLAQTVPQPLGQTGTWDLVFSDEFSSPSLSTTNWVTCYPWSGADGGCAHSSELEWYLPTNVSVSSGTARLTAKKQIVIGSDQKTYNYTSGMITTGRNKWDATPAKFAFTYGYIEVRAKVPSGQGLWPALWLLPFSDTDPGKWPPEIDIMELLGNDPTTAQMHFHYVNTSGVDIDSGGSYQGTNFSNDYHVFALSWEPTAIRWFIDGVERRTAFTDASVIPSEPMYFLANLAVGGSWPGAPDATTVFPNDFLVDYVRIWKKQPGLSLTPTASPVDTTAPQVTITSPLPNSIVPRSAFTTITATASDASSITKVAFYVNSSLQCTDTTAPYSCNWNVPTKKNTTYALTAKAYDPRGNIGTSSPIKVSAR